VLLQLLCLRRLFPDAAVIDAVVWSPKLILVEGQTLALMKLEGEIKAEDGLFKA